MSSTPDFKSLELSDKVTLLFREGEFVMSIRYYAYKVNLYLFHQQYFEVFFHHTDDRIEKIDFLDNDSSRMKFYADQIRLTNLAWFRIIFNNSPPAFRDFLIKPQPSLMSGVKRYNNTFKLSKNSKLNNYEKNNFNGCPILIS